jgi:hypothetical protein
MKLSKYVEELGFEEAYERSRDIGIGNSRDCRQERRCRGSSELG